MLQFMFPWANHLHRLLEMENILWCIMIQKMRWKELKKMNHKIECRSIKKEPLLFFSLLILFITLLIIILVFLYALGVNIISKIIPNIPEPNPVHFNHNLYLSFFSEIIIPLVFFIGSLGIIMLVSLKILVKRETFYGIKSEFISISYSMILIALSFQILGDKIPHTTTTDLLYFIALIFILFSFGGLIVGILYKYIGSSIQKDKE